MRYTTTQPRLQPELHHDDAARFLRRIGKPDPRPDRQTLQRILGVFSGFPYENVSKIIKLSHHFADPERLRYPEEVIEDHFRWRLGGTCFSLTFTLQTVLTRAGFICYPVMAHMRAGENIHCALIVLLEGRPHLVDPGYLLNVPFPLGTESPRIYHTSFTGVEVRFDPREEFYHLSTFNRQESKWRYRFRNRPTPPEEFLQHWLQSFYRPSMHGICITRASKEGLLYLHKDYFRRSNLDGKQSMRLKENVAPVVEQYFGIPAELVERAQEALARNLELERQYGIYRPRKEL